MSEPHWIAANDPASGKTYWYNEHDSSQTTWEDPTATAPQGAPVQVVVQQGGGSEPREWTSGRFDCFQDFGTCILGWCCPCVTFGQTLDRAKMMGCLPAGAMYIGPWIACYIFFAIIQAATGNQTNFVGIANLFGWIYMSCLGFQYRKKIVNKYGIMPWEGDFTEYICWCFCSCCSNIQEHKTLMHEVDACDGEWCCEHGQPQVVSAVVQQPPVYNTPPAPAPPPPAPAGDDCCDDEGTGKV